MFLGMMFVAAAAGGGLVRAYAAAPNTLTNDAAFFFARALSYGLMHIYAFKMAAVFMITTSTLAMRTRIAPTWIAWLGYTSAGFLLFGSGFLDWVLFVFPCWLLLLSVHILLDDLHRTPAAIPGRTIC
jgi:hypothetical protein